MTGMQSQARRATQLDRPTGMQAQPDIEPYRAMRRAMQSQTSSHSEPCVEPCMQSPTYFEPGRAKRRARAGPIVEPCRAKRRAMQSQASSHAKRQAGHNDNIHLHALRLLPVPHGDPAKDGVPVRHGALPCDDGQHGPGLRLPRYACDHRPTSAAAEREREAMGMDLDRSIVIERAARGLD